MVVVVSPPTHHFPRLATRKDERSHFSSGWSSPTCWSWPSSSCSWIWTSCSSSWSWTPPWRPQWSSCWLAGLVVTIILLWKMETILQKGWKWREKKGRKRGTYLPWEEEGKGRRRKESKFCAEAQYLSKIYVLGCCFSFQWILARQQLPRTKDNDQESER